AVPTYLWYTVFSVIDHIANPPQPLIITLLHEGVSKHTYSQYEEHDEHAHAYPWMQNASPLATGKQGRSPAQRRVEDGQHRQGQQGKGPGRGSMGGPPATGLAKHPVGSSYVLHVRPPLVFVHLPR